MSYSANNNQNYFVSSERTTSRVVAQPGGQCSISIGGWTPEELERQRKLREEREAATHNSNISVVKEPTSTEMTSKGATAVSETKEVVEEGQAEQPSTVSQAEDVKPAVTSAEVSSNAFASNASTNSFNVITDRPTSRVSCPPGGHCSIVLG